MKVLITNPPWIYRKRLKTFFGSRTGSRWPASYPAPSVLGQLTRAAALLRQGEIGKILSKIIRRYRRHKCWHIPLHDPCGYMPYPIFMGYATSFLGSKGIEAIFYDAGAQRDSYAVFFKTVDQLRPEIVIQETATATFHLDLKIAERLHKKYEVCLVGPQATALAQEAIALPYVDYVLKGAYEYSALEMIQTRRKGIYDYAIADINDLPYPYRDAKIVSSYRDFNCLKKLGFPQLWIYASRGCAFSCDFCLWVGVMFNHRFSLRDPEKVVGEVDDLARAYGFRHIYFDDDCWNIGPVERLIKIADGMKRLGLPWTINARLDLSAKEDFKYFIDRGCVGLRLGVESLSQRLLNFMHKGLRVEEIIEKIRSLENTGVELYLLFMHYLPGETDAARAEQWQKIEELGHRFQNPACIPYPGTAYYRKMLQAGFSLEKVGWAEFDAFNLGENLLQMIREYSEKIVE